MARRNRNDTPRYEPPRVDWFECEDCEFMFSTRAGAREQVEGADECPRCEGVGRIILGDVPLT